uniref:zinc finger protein 664-like n=1 Tax=Myxine glutinosa TaxID=7769 RepID=UPI00358F43F2
MDCARTNSRIGDIPAWLESRGLPEESLRAVVMGLGIEIFGVLCARAEPAPARVRLCSLSTREFTLAMYAKLCCFMESCIARKGSEQLVVPGCDNDSEKVGRTEVLQVKVEEEYLVDPEEEGSYTEDWRQVELIRKSPCTSGSQSFTTETPLKRNQPTSTDKKYKCTVCSYSSCRKWVFTRHTRVHTGEKPYTCRVCGKGFTSSSRCLVHMQIHSGEYPYTCTVCGKGFLESSPCQRHMRIHSGERPYTCMICGKAFLESTPCQRHMRVHSGERPYICGVCGKGFVTSYSYSRHYRIHTRKQ